MALFRPRLDHHLGVGNLGEPPFAPRQLFDDRHYVRRVGLIGHLRTAQQIGHAQHLGLFEEAASEYGDGVVVGMLVDRNEDPAYGVNLEILLPDLSDLSPEEPRPRATEPIACQSPHDT